jgi:NADH:ubiquinone oxidoreductase subunit 6 (subunit J)
MKRIVIVCGLIAGLIVSAMMVISIAFCYKKGNFEGNIWLGYTSMLIAFSLIFVGIKNYRDKHNNGVISFGKAFKIGLYISLVASTLYVAVWLIDYYFFVPDFMDKYANSMIDQKKAAGASPAEISKEVATMEGYKEMYKNPLMVVLFTYFEILPVALVVSLISALLLKRKRTGQAQTAFS